MSIKKKPYKDRSLSISATVCLQKLHQERVCRESNQSCLWFTTLIPTSSQGIRDHCLWNCLSEPTASPHSLTKTGFPSTVVYLPHFFTSTSYGLTTKLPAFTQEVGLVWSTAARLGTDWVLWRTQGAAAVTPFTFFWTARKSQNCQTKASCASAEITTQRSTWITSKFAL